MFNFSIDFVEGLNGTEKLADTLIDGIPLYSTLDRLINCLQGNFARTLHIMYDSEMPCDLEIIPKDMWESFSKEHQESLIESKDPKEKENFFWVLSHRDPHFINEHHHVGETWQISDAQFHILSEAIKKSSALDSLELLLSVPLTEYQEKELVVAVSENASINSVILMGHISSSTIKAMEAITEQRPKLKINSDYTEVALQRKRKEDWSDRDNTVQHTPAINMHLLQGFIAVLGAAAVATSFVLLYATALNPIGLILTASGGAAALTYGAYSFFSSKDTSKQTDDIKLDSPVLTM